ncbi:hypothetical protein HYE35_00840 [Mycoplasmopsis bovis]|nr:hypothetical protein [Mycoplasmopsis bovis]QQH21594.1 hypothetical protein HYE35_00840 [Mycoplasmopsis bovis]
MNKVNRKFLTAMGGGIITSLALPIVAALCNNKNQKETGKENKNKNIADTIPSDNTHSANNSSSESDKSKNADNSNSNSNSNVNNSLLVVVQGKNAVTQIQIVIQM